MSTARRRRLLTLVGQRIVQIPLVLVVVSILTFWLVQVVPGTPVGTPWAVRDGGAGARLERRPRTRRVPREPVPALDRRVRHGDWGTSFVYSEPVRDLVLGRLGNSLLLGAYAFVIMVPVAIALGAVQAYRQGRRSDRAITVGLLTVSAVPEFVVGIVLLLVFAVWLKVVPVQASGALDAGFGERLRVLTLPAVVLALAYLAVLTRMVRAGTIETIRSQFHRTAVLKGLTNGQIVRRHVIRNALIPTFSVLGIYLGTLLGGSVIVETLFSYPGLGALLVSAAERKDALLLESGVMLAGALSLGALLLTDLVFVVVDPRIRFERKATA
ncbi:ABC transporter permease [Curtobacterium flaccumfaciens]|nr:ABC transporter permease [Curtobacterium flaccumfaciens]